MLLPLTCTACLTNLNKHLYTTQKAPGIRGFIVIGLEAENSQTNL